MKKKYLWILVFALSAAIPVAELQAATRVYSDHPRLLFDSKELILLRQRASANAKGNFGSSSGDLFRAMKKRADFAIKKWKLPSSPPRDIGKFKLQADRFQANILIISFVYAITGDKRYLNKAKDALLTLARWSHWSYWQGQRVVKRTGTLDMGAITCGVAYAYDWIYHGLNVREREQIRSALIAKGILPLYRGSSEAKLWPFKYPKSNNWFIIGTSALGIGALAILGEDSRAEEWLREATEKSELFINLSGGEDGEYAESVSYGNFSMSRLIRFVDSLRRVKGIDLEKTDKNQWIKNYPYFKLYTVLPDWSGHLNFNDESTSVTGGKEIMVRATTAYKGHPVSNFAQWYVKKAFEISASGLLNPFNFANFDPTIKPEKPTELPKYKHFKNTGWIVFREDWDRGMFFAFKAQSSDAVASAHLHYDGGHFVLYKDAWLLTDAGYQTGTTWGSARRRGNDALNLFSKGSFGHNTIIVDSFSQSQYNSKLTDFFGTNYYAFLRADMADTYYAYDFNKKIEKGEKLLDEFYREIILVPPDYLISFDRIKTRAKARNIEFLLHGNVADTKNKSVIEAGYLVKDNQIWIKPKGSETELSVTFIYPDDAKIEKTTYRGAEKYGTYLSTSPNKKVRDLRILTVLYPKKVRERMPKISRTETGNLIVIKIENEAGIDNIFVCKDTHRLNFENMIMEASRCVIRRNNSGSLYMFALQDGKLLEENERVLFKSDKPASALVYGDKAIVKLDGDATVQIYSENTRKTMEFKLKAGRNEIKLF